MALAAGERRYLALTHDIDEPVMLPILGDPARRKIDLSIDYWRRWSDQCTYDPSPWLSRLSPGARRSGRGVGDPCLRAVEVLATTGRLGDARERLRRLIGYANDVGLYSEEIDAGTGRALGNFPQAITHVGLIHAALAVTRIERGLDREPGT